MSDKVVAFIPARMSSSRFPGKPLVSISGLPMIEHVRRRAALCPDVDEAVVATCDQAIFDVVTKAGGKAVMTAASHERCTDRVAEAALSIPADIALVVQGDEPLLVPDVLTKLAAPFKREQTTRCTNLVSVIDDPRDLDNTDIVKAVLNEQGEIMFFSRAPIPFQRVAGARPMFRQTGLSGFTRSFLLEFSAMAPTQLEIIESIDFLRIVGHGCAIQSVVFNDRTIGVDRPSDVAEVEKVLLNDPVQKALHERIMAGGL